jgi:hypothetical protein
MPFLIRNTPEAMYAILAAYNTKQRSSARGDVSSAILGDGNDGAQTFDGTSTITLGGGGTMAPTNGVYTATRDLYFSSLTIKDGVVLNMAGFKLFCNGTIANGSASPPSTTIAVASNNAALPQATVNVANTTGFLTAGAFYVPALGSVVLYTGDSGTTFTTCTMLSGTPEGTLLTGQVVQAIAVIHNCGNVGGVGSSGTGGTAGAISAAGSTAQGTAGGAGASGSGTGAAGTAATTGFPGGTGVGGAGGTGTGAGGAAGTWTALATTKGGARWIWALIAGLTFGTAGVNVFGGGSGGGGGTANNADAGGGGGGGGGGVLIVVAFNLANYGIIAANGGNGGNGFSTAHDAGGGGGGGGGVAITVSRTRSGTGLVTANGGLGGAKVASGGAGVAGTAGVVEQVGTATYFHYDVTPGTLPAQDWETPLPVPALQVTAPTPTTLAQVVTAAENIRSVLLAMFADAPVQGLSHSGGAHAAADTTNAPLISYALLPPLLPTTAGMPATVTGAAATYAAVTASHTLTLSFNGRLVVVTFTGSEASQAAFHSAINAAIAAVFDASLVQAGQGGYAQDNGGQTMLATNGTGNLAVGAVVAGSADVLTSLGLAVGALTGVTYVTQPATQSQADTLLNACQTAFNAHLTLVQSGVLVHVQNDNVNTSGAASATNLSTSETLATDLTNKVNAHVLSASPDPLIHLLY